MTSVFFFPFFLWYLWLEGTLPSTSFAGSFSQKAAAAFALRRSLEGGGGGKIRKNGLAARMDWLVSTRGGGRTCSVHTAI